MKIKVIIDLCMTILLLLLMAFQITGQQLHEWFGAGMLVLFLVHNILNYRWYKNLLKGKYNLVRVLQTAINFAVLISMLCLAYSGIVMSNYVFGFVAVKGEMALARQMHMAASYWVFVGYYMIKLFVYKKKGNGDVLEGANYFGYFGSRTGCGNIR
ncbi:MAG: DUF4405 domain-containing protein [Bacteroidales bacterium]|nr:DUF4405 domain-containing protein [Clostridium sp.]MCM1204899.1 DUF4405 domain-containing protein [Bacteroidales bacterium]